MNGGDGGEDGGRYDNGDVGGEDDENMLGMAGPMEPASMVPQVSEYACATLEPTPDSSRT